jgi:hypothetical protein
MMKHGRIETQNYTRLDYKQAHYGNVILYRRWTKDEICFWLLVH